jgi:hypothetical protein
MDFIDYGAVAPLRYLGFIWNAASRARRNTPTKRIGHIKSPSTEVTNPALDLVTAQSLERPISYHYLRPTFAASNHYVLPEQ